MNAFLYDIFLFAIVDNIEIKLCPKDILNSSDTNRVLIIIID